MIMLIAITNGYAMGLLRPLSGETFLHIAFGYMTMKRPVRS